MSAQVITQKHTVAVHRKPNKSLRSAALLGTLLAISVAVNALIIAASRSVP